VAKPVPSITNYEPERGAQWLDVGNPIVTNILLVDDHPPNLLALEAILRPLGHRLISACSGRDALEFLAKEDVAVVLLDVRMPGLDGFSTAELIRQERQNARVPIIFLTAADTDPVDILRGYERGAVDFLMKPFEPEILRSKVLVFVELHQKEQIVRRQAAQLRLQEREALERRSATRFHQLLDGLPICVVVTDGERRPYYWNRSALRYIGVAAKRGVLSPTLFDFVHGDDLGHLAAEWTTEEHGRCQFEIKFRLRRSDGSYRWHLGRGVPQLDGSQTVTGWILGATDIEDEQRALAGLENETASKTSSSRWFRMNCATR
jgi:PAS domain S-box-containing protein